MYATAIIPPAIKPRIDFLTVPIPLGVLASIAASSTEAFKSPLFLFCITLGTVISSWRAIWKAVALSSVVTVIVIMAVSSFVSIEIHLLISLYV